MEYLPWEAFLTLPSLFSIFGLFPTSTVIKITQRFMWFLFTKLILLKMKNRYSCSKVHQLRFTFSSTCSHCLVSIWSKKFSLCIYSCFFREQYLTRLGNSENLFQYLPRIVKWQKHREKYVLSDPLCLKYVLGKYLHVSTHCCFWQIKVTNVGMQDWNKHFGKHFGNFLKV